MRNSILKILLPIIIISCGRLPSSGQFNPQSIGTIPLGDSVILVYDVTINNGAGNISNQGTISGTGFTTFNTNDPKTGTAGDATVTVVGQAGYWTGATSSGFHLASNWDALELPTGTTDITIPTGVGNMPVLSQAESVKNITLQNATTLSLNGHALTVNGNITVAGTGKIIGSSSSSLSLIGTGASTVTLDQTTDGTTNALSSLTVNGTGGVNTLTGKLNIYSLLTITAGNLNLNGNNVVLKSTSISNTAMVGQVGGTISYGSGGKFTAERYIPLGKRAYRLLATGISTSVNGTAASTIYQNWQNGGANTAGIGTHITGSAAGSNGLDATPTGDPSMFTYTSGSLTYSAVTSTNQTNDTLSAIRGYRLFMRGDRNANLSTANNSGAGTPNINLNVATTLSAAGRLISGTVVFNSTKTTISGTDGWQWENSNAPLSTGTGASDSYSLIANPYLAMVDWDAVVTNDLSTTYYVWDPNKNLRGGYETYNKTGQTASSANISRYIQPGQAFFVQTTGAAPSLTITEANKNVTGANLLNAFRTHPVYPSIDVQLVYNSRPNSVADNAMAIFSNSFSDDIAGEDSYKQTNPDDNVAIVKSNKALVFEGRKNITAPSTIPLRLYGLQTDTSYSLRIETSNITLPAGLNAYLEDAYTNTSTQINLNGTITQPFTKLADSASFYNRFSMVFRAASPLPITVTGVKAYQKGSGVQVEFSNSQETNVKHYEIEESADGVTFTKAITLQPKSNNSSAVNYDWFDAVVHNGYNYYRIRSESNSNEVKYTSTVKVKMGKAGSFSVYPNPVKGKSISLALTDVPEGEYTVTMFSASGQQVLSQKLNHRMAVPTQTIRIPVLAAGRYTLQLKGKVVTAQQTIIIDPTN